MNKFLLLFLSFTLSFSALVNAQIDIAVARGMVEGTSVTIEGIATNGNEMGPIRYLQDATGAIPAYPGTGSVPNFPENVNRGDLVRVTGVLKTYNGLLEMDPITAFTVVSNNNPLPAPMVVTPTGINEANEAKLLQINGVTFANAGSVFSVGNHTFTANGESSEIYIRTGHPLIGVQIPLAQVNLTGISSEFNGLYQLLPRDADDMEIADDFYINGSPFQFNITPTGFKVFWTTNVAGSTNLRYGTTTSFGQEINITESVTDHTVEVTGLEPATFYYIEAYSNNGTTTATSAVGYFSTGSLSTGTTRVYFNHGVDINYSTGGHYPSGTTPAAMEAAIIARINAAKTSIDVAIYNNNRKTIIEALTNAYNNGIVVRYVTDDETGNLALQDPTPPFPVMRGNSGSPLMHNKFFIFDADSQNDSWLIMGSVNMTDNNLADDYNNMVVLQDEAVAKAYTVEFEEMWGSDGPSPGVFNVKFGELKTNNTPHNFILSDGTAIESYFSPSDNTSIGISNALAQADHDIEFAMLTFTDNELGNAILNKHNAGVAVRGIIDNTNDSGSEYDYLKNNGVDVLPDMTTAQTHHKYCIIDAGMPDSDPMVVTGSHNWSASANTRNDENTLIFHNEAMANIFLQEFEARWCEANGGTGCIVFTEEINGIDGFDATIFPNPATDFAQVKMELAEPADLVMSLWDFNGKMLSSSILHSLNGEHSEPLYLNGLAAGTYFVTFTTKDQATVRKLMIVR